MAQITAKTDWQSVCDLSSRLTNSVGEHGGLAWMANNSIGGRAWSAGRAKEKRDSGFDGNWLGFAEEGTTRLWWQSATSGAVLEAKKGEDGQWTLTFEGTTSWYVSLFVRAAEPDSVQVVEAEGIEAVVQRLRQSLESEVWYKDTHWGADPTAPPVRHMPEEEESRIRAFLDTLGFGELDRQLAREEALELQHDRW